MVEEVIEMGIGYKLYRERDAEAVRLIAKRIDVVDQANYSMRVIEIKGNMLRLYKRWSYPWSWGEKVIFEVQLEPASAEKVRGYICRVRSLFGFDEVAYWLLTARYRATPGGGVVIDSVEEPQI